MCILEGEFQESVHQSNDGFGAVWTGVRDESPRLVRILPALRGNDVSPTMASQLAAPGHEVLLPVEVGTAGSSVYLAAPHTDHTPLHDLVRDDDWTPLAEWARPDTPGALLSVATCAEIGIALAEAARAVVGKHGIGPLSWHNVYLDDQDPTQVRVFPLWPAPTRSAHWLSHDPADLLFMDRDRLRQAPTWRSDAFAIGAVLLALLQGRDSFTATHRDPAEFMREAVFGDHPLIARVTGEGPLHAVLRRALGAGEPYRDMDALLEDLVAARQALDPVTRAERLIREGDGNGALRLLHQAIRGGQRSWHLYVFKARLEWTLEHRLRALKTLRAGREVAPRALPILMMLARYSSDPAESVDAMRSAVALAPLDPAVHVQLVHALWAADQKREALSRFVIAQSLASLDPRAARECVQLAEFTLRVGDRRAALGLASAYTAPSIEPEARAHALSVLGRAWHAMGEFEPAADALRASVELHGELGRAPCTELLNDLAFSLVAIDQNEEAAKAALTSLAIDPGQERMVRFLTALDVHPEPPCPDGN